MPLVYPGFAGLPELNKLSKEEFQVNRGEPVSSASLCKMGYAKQPEREDGKSDTGSRTTPYYRRVRVMPQEGRELHVAISLRETYPILRD